VNQWAVQREGSDRASSLHDTRAEAIGQGRFVAQTGKTEFVTHDLDGEIQDQVNYGNVTTRRAAASFGGINVCSL
jgi:hypothetical protein